METTRHRGFARIACAAVLLCLAVRPAVGGPLDEYRIKAAFLYNFAKFVEWNTSASPLIILVFGHDPFGAALDQTVAGKTINDRPLQIRRATRIEEIEPCDLVFIDAAERRRLAEVLRVLAGRPVLTVSESAEFLRAGGMVNFLLQDNKVRFEINAEAAQRQGVRISSRLLSLAAAVRN